MLSPLHVDSLVVISWNTCKKGASAAGRICKHIRRQFGSFIGLLQEIPAWGKLKGFTYSDHTVVSFENCDCGFLIPRPRMSAVRSLSSGAYWCGLVIDTYIFISAHVLDHLEEDGRAETVFKETHNYVHDIRHNHADIQFEIVMGVDTNVGYLRTTMVLPEKMCCQGGQDIRLRRSEWLLRGLKRLVQGLSTHSQDWEQKLRR